MPHELLAELRHAIELMRADHAAQRENMAEIRQRLNSLEVRLKQIDIHLTQGPDALVIRTAMLESRLLTIEGTLKARQDSNTKVTVAVIAAVGSLIAAIITAFVK